MNHRATAGRRRKASDIVQKPWVRLKNPLPRTPLVSADEIEAIHLAALRLLEETGMRCHVAEARHLMRMAGALVDDGEARVRVGRDIIEKALTTVPPEITLTPRNGERAISIGGNNLTTSAIIGPPHVTDLVKGRRTGTLADFSDFMRLTQFFNAVQVNGWPVEPLDIEVRHRHLEADQRAQPAGEHPAHPGTGRSDPAQGPWSLGHRGAAPPSLNRQAAFSCRL